MESKIKEFQLSKEHLCFGFFRLGDFISEVMKSYPSQEVLNSTSSLTDMKLLKPLFMLMTKKDRILPTMETKKEILRYITLYICIYTYIYI